MSDGVWVVGLSSQRNMRKFCGSSGLRRLHGPSSGPGRCLGMPGPCPHWAEGPRQVLPRGSVSSPRKPASRSDTEPVAAWPYPGAAWFLAQPEHEGTGQQSCSQRGRGPSGDGVTQSRAADLRARAGLSSHVLARLGVGAGPRRREEPGHRAWPPDVWPSPRRGCVSRGIYVEARPGVGAAIRCGQAGESIWSGGLFRSLGHGKGGCFDQGREDLPVLSQTLLAAADTEGAFPAKARGTGCPTALAAAWSLPPSCLALPLSLYIMVSPDPSKSQQGCISPAQSGRRLLYLKFVPTPQTPEAACFATPHKCPPPFASVAGGAGGRGRRLWPGVAAVQGPRSRAC